MFNFKFENLKLKSIKLSQSTYEFLSTSCSDTQMDTHHGNHRILRAHHCIHLHLHLHGQKPMELRNTSIIERCLMTSSFLGYCFQADKSSRYRNGQ